MNLQRTNLRGARLIGAHLEKAILMGARLEVAVLAGAHLEGAQLMGARLEGAALMGARLEGAILWNAVLDGRTSLRGATGLTREQLAKATLDEKTILPDYLREKRPGIRGRKGNSEE